MKRRYAIGLLIVLMLQAGCGTSSSLVNDNSKATITGDETDLTVYLNDFDEMIGPLFEEATGYKVNLVQGGGAEILSRIEAERGNPHWDVVWLDMISSIHGLGMSGMLYEDYTPDNASKLTDVYRSLVPEQRWYYPTSAHAASVIVYHNDELSAAEAPKSWEDFSDPAFNEMIGIADPTIAAPAYSFINWFFYKDGMDSGKQMISDWLNNGLSIFPKNPNVAMALLSGQIKIAALQESNAHRLIQENEKLSLVWPEEGAPASVRVAAISKDTTKLEAAKAFVNFLLDPATQQAIIEASDEAYHEPSAQGVTPKLERDSGAKLLFADAMSSYKQEAEIKQWFADYSIR